jgi:hypothetical protein
MSLTVQQARDEMSALFATAWSPRAVIWDGLVGKPPSGRTPWARFTIRHAEGGSAAIGHRKFRREGTIFIQLFAPVGDGLSSLDPLTKIAMDAYEGQSTAGGAWFRDVRCREIGPDGDWYQVNVLVDFEYDEIK